MGVEEVVRYLVVKRLACDVVTLFVIKEYLVDGESPSTIAHKYKVSKHVVRGYAQRVLYKVGYSYRIATSVVKAVFPYVMNIEPIVLRLNGHCYCLLCGEDLSPSVATAHLLKRHKEYIKQAVEYVMSRLRH